MKPFTNFESRMVPLPINNIDTDQIIPARFLKTTSKQGLDKQLFNDWRYDAQGNPKPDFILNQPRGAGRAGAAGRRQFRLRQFARARAVGADAVRIPRGDQHLVRRHLQAEFAQELAAADRGARRTCTPSCSPPRPDATVKIDLAAQTLTTPSGGRRIPGGRLFKHCLLKASTNSATSSARDRHRASKPARRLHRYPVAPPRPRSRGLTRRKDKRMTTEELCPDHEASPRPARTPPLVIAQTSRTRRAAHNDGPSTAGPTSGSTSSVIDSLEGRRPA